MCMLIYITCVIHDPSNGNIISVGTKDQIYFVNTVVQWINSGKWVAYTWSNDKAAKVYAKQSISGKWYLTTEPNNTKEDNLDFLPECLVRQIKK